MGKKLLLVVLVLLPFLLSAQNALAAKNDISLWRFCERNPKNGQCVPNASNENQVKPNNEKFGKFAEQLSAVIAPKFHAPAETLGWLGWGIGFEFSLNDIPDGDQWNDALENVERFEEVDTEGAKQRSAPSFLNTTQFHVRKGLPYSTEVGFIMTYLIGSKSYAAGMEAKFSFLEGFKYLPDGAVRMNYQHLFGVQDLELDQLGWDLSVSKNFGLGGFIQLAPYSGYSFVHATVAPRAVNADFDKDNNGRLLMLEKKRPIIHRWFIGLRFLAHHVSFIPEIDITSASVYNYSFSLGADF